MQHYGQLPCSPQPVAGPICTLLPSFFSTHINISHTRSFIFATLAECLLAGCLM